MGNERNVGKESGELAKPGSEVGIYSPLQVRILQAAAQTLHDRGMVNFSVTIHPDQTSQESSSQEDQTGFSRVFRIRRTPASPQHLPEDQVRVIIQDNDERPTRGNREYFRSVYHAAEFAVEGQIAQDQDTTLDQVVGDLLQPFLEHPSLLKEFRGFLGMPSSLFMKDFVREVFKAGMPNDEDAYWRYENAYNWQRAQKPQVPPLVPLLALPVIAVTLEDNFRADYPKGKYSFAADLMPILARSDDPRAYQVLTDHILTPFPRNQRQAFDGPNEMQLKASWVRDLTSSITHYGTPESNPLARQALIDIYKGLSPSGRFYEDTQLEGDERRIRDLREMRLALVGEFSRIQDPELFGYFTDFLNNEKDAPDTRVLVMSQLRYPSKEVPSSWYEQIVQLATHLNILTPEAGSLLMQHVNKGSSQESLSTYNQALESVINQELALWAMYGQAFDTYEGQHIEQRTGNLQAIEELVKLYSCYQPDFAQAEAYLLGLVENPSTPARVATHAAWQLQKPLEWAQKLTTADKKRVAMRLIRSILTTDPSDYEAKLANREGYQILGVANEIIYHDKKVFDEMSEEDMRFLADAANAYAAFRASHPVNGYDSVAHDIEQLSEQSQERLMQIRIHTEPDTYTRWFFGRFADFAQYYNMTTMSDGNRPSGLERQAWNVFEAAFGQLQALAQAPDTLEKRIAVLHVLARLHQEMNIHDLGYNTGVWQKGLPMLHIALDYLPDVMREYGQQLGEFKGLLREKKSTEE